MNTSVARAFAVAACARCGGGENAVGAGGVLADCQPVDLRVPLVQPTAARGLLNGVCRHEDTELQFGAREDRHRVRLGGDQARPDASR